MNHMSKSNVNTWYLLPYSLWARIHSRNNQYICGVPSIPTAKLSVDIVTLHRITYSSYTILQHRRLQPKMGQYFECTASYSQKIIYITDLSSTCNLTGGKALSFNLHKADFSLL